MIDNIVPTSFLYTNQPMSLNDICHKFTECSQEKPNHYNVIQGYTSRRGLIRSWNCGSEGRTSSREINYLRRKLIRNALTVLLLSRGTPMLLSGDEFMNSQGGNNNAYCQDNEVSWLNWDDLKANQDLHDYVQTLISFRKDHPVIRRKSGLELAGKLRDIRDDIMIVFITAHDEYIHEANEINSDHYIVKPYTEETLINVMEKLRLLSARQHKDIYIQTFGRFLVFKKGKPVRITGKAKEILALIVTRRGKEISNEEIYSTIWEGRPYSNSFMSVYYNALRRLNNALKAAEIRDILVSTPRGQTVDTALFDCDYYAWKDKNADPRDLFEGEFMSEYSWGEYILAALQHEEWGDY